MSNHRSAANPLPVARAAGPGVIGSSQNNNSNNMAPAAPTNDAPQSYAQDHYDRYVHINVFLKEVDDAKNVLIEDLLSRYDAVMRERQILIDTQNAREIHISQANQVSALLHDRGERIVDLENDLENRVNRIVDLENDLENRVNRMNSNPFIVVIVDGNNFFFNDAFIRDGENGGRRAAVALKNEVTKWVSESIEDAPSEFKILTQVYADFKGLAGILIRGGIIENLSTFGDFAHGFNTLFNFVDIGGGDVNSKLVDYLKLFLHDCHCRQVIFGGAPQVLNTNVEQEDELIDRVALLQSVSTNVNIPFKKVSFTEVFRTSKIITSIAATTPRTGTPASAVVSVSGNLSVPHSQSDSRTNLITPSNATVTPRTGMPASLVESGGGKLPLPHSRSDSGTSSVTSVTSATAPAGKPSWATLVGVAAPLPQTSMVPRPVDPPLRLHNKKGERIDPPFTLDWDALKRVKKIKMCNMHYLHPKGCKFSEGKCQHRHDYKATNAEIDILRSVSRETACLNGVRCSDVPCLYGHRCPYPPVNSPSQLGHACTLGDRCRFPKEMHSITDNTPAKATNAGKR